MPPTSRSIIDDETPGQAHDHLKYLDVDTIRNSDRIVAVFSQCRWDGRITFAIHREFDKIGQNGHAEVSKTSFVPETLAGSYAALVELALENLEKLKARRSAGSLPFPEGGLERRPRQR
jgi:hypothetical protein